MGKRIMYIACSPVCWVDVAKKLMRQNQWEPCYWIGRPFIEKTVKDCFSGVIFHDLFDALKNVPPAEGRNFQLPALDEDLLRALSFNELIALKMMDRIDRFGALDYEKRKNIYHDHLRYWLAVIDYLKPDIFFSPSAPHQVYDYILYSLCRIKGIKTILFCSAYDLRRLFPVEDFEKGSLHILSVYQERLRLQANTPVVLSKETEDYISETKGTYEDGMHYCLKPIFERERKNSGLFSFLKRLVKSALIGLKSPRSFKESVTPELTVWKLKSHYRKLAAAPDLSLPYVYVALHQQPENSTSPEGGVFVDQWLMLIILSRSVPKEWVIYVKEHPSQLIPRYGGNKSARSISFYNDIAALPNVKFIPVEFPSFNLIDSSRAIATVTGTVGWEAVVRGKPALYFGHPWYRGCEGTFFTPDYQRCRKAISKIASGFKVNYERVRLFAKVIEENGCSRLLYDRLNELYFKSASDKDFENIQNTSVLQDELYLRAVSDMAECMRDFYEKNRQEYKVSGDKNIKDVSLKT